MLTRHTTTYGLLACLAALVALGLQPYRVGKVAAVQRGPTEQAPGEESGDEEQEAEEESAEVTPIRRKVLVGLHASGDCRHIAAISSTSPLQSAFTFAPRLPREHTARNGVGGPLRL